MIQDYTQISNCPITNSDKKITYLNLGNMPLVNNLFDTQEQAINCDKYPLEVGYFTESGLSSLNVVVDGDKLFSQYTFKSDVNTPYKKHCELMCDYINSFRHYDNGDIIVDIGGNDGTLLETFRSKLKWFDTRVNYLNIDPSVNLTQISRDKGINSITSFFTKELIEELKFKANVITSTNVFQHLKDINNFVEGIKLMLSEDGIWVLEFPYWGNSMETNQFDQVYHEHFYYYLVTPLNELFKKHGLKIIDISEHDMHGGSLRLIISHNSRLLTSTTSLDYFLKKEEKYDLEYHLAWAEDVKEFIHKSACSLEELLYKGNKIWGFGASAKGCIFLNSMGFDYRDIDCIIDDTDLKQNKYMPGTGIKIVDRSILSQEQPHYILILSHNFKDHIIKSLKESGYRGKFICLIPEFTIYE